MNASKLDEIMPRWQFVERHEIRIAAPPERIYAAIRNVTRAARSVSSSPHNGPLHGALPREGEHPPRTRGQADPRRRATRSGFRMLADDPPRELVIGTHVAPQTFAVMNFRVNGDGLVTTETRVFAQTDTARRKFAIYWRFIRPGSGIIRLSWLEAIKRRAEARP